MKKILNIMLLSMLVAQISYSQKRTVINGFVESVKDSTFEIRLLVMDGMFASRTSQEWTITSKDGKFFFEFPIKVSSLATLYINNKIAFVPGTFEVIINPGDSLHLSFPSVQKLGFPSMEVRGLGSDKIRLTKDVLNEIYSNKLFKKPWNKLTITEKYLQADRELDIIDSMFSVQTKPLSSDYQLAKAQLIQNSLDMNLIHSVGNKSDSVAILFKQFVVNKKRIEPLFDAKSIGYFGAWRVLPNYLAIYSRVTGGEELFDSEDRSRYRAMIVKVFGDKPIVRDYMLSDMAISVFERHKGDEISKQTYNFYLANADKKNPHYQEVVKSYKYISHTLRSGQPFYKFSLPDTAGRLHNLEDFKGKVVVLDFWFNGCSACKSIAPYISKIEQEMKDEAIQFISISIDDKKYWKLGIGKFSSEHSLQLYTEGQRINHPIINFAKVVSYPTLIVLDKNGNIVGLAPRPDQDIEGFKAYIKKLL